MNIIVLGRVFEGNTLIGLRVFCVEETSFRWVSKCDFNNMFKYNNVLNCKLTSSSLISKISWLPMNSLAKYGRFGNLLHIGLYSDSKLISILLNQNEDIVFIRVCGAIAGAITNKYSTQAEAHADMYYREIHSMSTDVIKIANNTGFSLEQVNKIKNYVFLEYHNLSTGFKQFDPSFTIALSWQRLMQNNYKSHELMELELVNSGMSQDEAHIRAQQVYNYDKEVKEYHAKTGKY